MRTDEYFKRYFEETDKINDFFFLKEVEIKGTLHLFEYNLTKEDILKEILKMPKGIKKQIKEKFVYLDFENRDINLFVDYLLKGHYNLLIEQFKKSEE